MRHAVLRFPAMASHFMVVASAAINTGVVAWLIMHERLAGLHIIWEIVVSTVTLGLYLSFMFLPLYKYYRGHLAIIHFPAFGLWVVSFVFTVIDWNGNKCKTSAPYSVSPPESGKCGMKHCVEAFNFIGLFFLLVVFFLEGLLLRLEINIDPDNPQKIKENPEKTHGHDEEVGRAV